ncbi:MAG TPA: hypothetical protein VM409_07920 [Chloroflexia bacterium]|nr:hypothetical protein [Chloroflexia bacterium]
MAHKMRHATIGDLLGIRRYKRKYRVLRLDPPYTFIQPGSHTFDLWRSQALPRTRSSFAYVYVERGAVLGYVQARCGWHTREEWTITTMGVLERAPSLVMDQLLEQVCREAGQAGALRIFAKVPEETPGLNLFRGLGFTHYTSEEIWGNLYFGQSGTLSGEPAHDGLRRQRRQDAWDVMKLYSSLTPPAVQRAENLDSREWQRGIVVRPLSMLQGLTERAYVWADENDHHSLGGYARLLTGKGGHWISLLFKPDGTNRRFYPRALDFVLWKASQQGSKPVYCGVREYQGELAGELGSRGFHCLSNQALLVKYMAVPVKSRQPAMLPFLVPKAQELAGRQ